MLYDCSVITGTNKQKAKIDQKLKSNLREMDKLIERYHEVLPCGLSQPREQVQRSQLTSSPPQFPWANETRPGAQLIREYFAVLAE